MKKIMILMSLFASNVFALSLGDVVNNNTMKIETTTNTRMVLSTTKADHSEYTISKSTGSATALVNNKNQVYGFTWKDKAPDIKGMLGTNSTYKAEFDNAYANRPLGDHRHLTINTDHLSVSQFGLPGGPFSGSMTAKDLVPTN